MEPSPHERPPAFDGTQEQPSSPEHRPHTPQHVFNHPLQKSLYLSAQKHSVAPKHGPKQLRGQQGMAGVNRSLPQLEKTFLAQKQQQLRTSLQGPIMKCTKNPATACQNLPPLDLKSPVPLAPALRKTSKFSEPEGGKLGLSGEGKDKKRIEDGSLHAVASGEQHQQQQQQQAAASPQSPAPKNAALGSAANLAYVKLIYTLREYPNTEDFVYLNRINKNPNEYDPYSLEVMPFAAINQEDFYTMSVRGITHYQDGISVDFATLDQWERELQLYSSLKGLRVFRMYKLWKSFRLWKRAVNQTKFSKARDSLKRNLFMLSPVFQGPLQRFHCLCYDLSHLRLHALKPNQASSLKQLVDQQRNRQAETEAQLHEFHAAAMQTVVSACGDDLVKLEERLQEFNKQHDEGEHLGQHGDPKQMHQSAIKKEEQHKEKEINDTDFAYTIAAARRSEQRRLLCYVRMSDYMVCDTLHTVLLASVQEVLQAVKPRDVVEPAEGVRDPAPPSPKHTVDRIASFDLSVPPVLSTETSMAQRSGGSFKGWGSGPIFEVELLLEDDTAELLYDPAPEDYQEQIAEILQGYLNSMCTLTRLYGNPTVLEAVMQVKDANVEPGTELQELIVNEDYEILVEKVQNSLMDAFDVAEEHKEEYFVYREMLLDDQHLDIESLGPAFKAKNEQRMLEYSSTSKAAPRPSEEPSRAHSQDYPPQDASNSVSGLPSTERVTLQTFRALMDSLIRQRERMQALSDSRQVSILRVDCKKLKAALVPAPSKCLEQLHVLIPALASDLFQSFMGEVQSALSKLQQPTSAVEDYVAKVQFLIQAREAEKGWDYCCNEVHDLYNLIDQYGIEQSAMDKAAYATLDSAYNQLKGVMEEVESTRDENISKYSIDLEHGIESVNKELVSVRNMAQHEMVLNEESDYGRVTNYLAQLKESVDRLRSEAQRINKYQALFNVPESRCEDLEEASDEVSLKLQLWEGRAEFDDLVAQWRQTHFESLDVQAFEDTIMKYHKAVLRMERGLVPNKLVPAFRAHVDELRSLIPVTQALRNRALKERHWTKIFSIIGQVIPRDSSFTLQALLDAKVHHFKNEVTQVSTEASQELALEELLGKVQARWNDVEFNVIPYKDVKDVFMLGSIDDIQAALEDSMVTMSSILASRFVSGIRAEVEKVERQLTLFTETLDEWVTAQKAWVYLEPIFSAPDIQRQLPVEAKAFAHVDKQLRDIMRKTKDRPNALQAGTVPGLLDTFRRANETLEKVQKNLEDYLEIKRMGFPRFYFLSNDELLEILAQTKNVQAVQPHMGKCFDGIRRLDFGDDPKSIDIHAMISGEGERVNFSKPLKARGNVEKWLSDVESMMIVSLRKLAKTAFLHYTDRPRTKWVLEQPAQLVLVVSQIHWCATLEAKLASKNPVAAMQDFLQANIRQLADLTWLVRGELSSLHRKILAALITVDVHARDIVADLLQRNTRDVNEFEWQMQLRYYYENEDVVVRQVNARFNYAYEYLGAQSRLVVTPMTDRCYLTLTGALHLKLGGAPAGPAGTGKTETTKDLGKALGVNCVVFNCGENLDFRFMGKFFSGLAQCGAWACFDEFNRIDIEVLSVVAQQLLTIQNALKAQMPSFNFEGRIIKLLPSCGVFITMNPGYAGRTELPDNLKALFRPMAMMIPDYALVAEVMLFSEGFEDSKTLSRKMVNLYKLSSEQLSQQDHYDFGMRAVKSVLVMAGSLKRSNPDLPEDVVLIRAMRDSNLPKFLADDVELFQNIIHDLFPSVVVPDQDHGVLEKAVHDVLDERGLQAPSRYVTKIIQLYDTMEVRFGVVIVGPSGGGKSECYHTLQGALTHLRTKLHSNIEAHQVTHTYPFNPKSISMGELYGQYNNLTGEWMDGLGSTLIRSAVNDPSPDKKWVVFDGPIDTLWIENMNTVLDDNCTLCLPNGERIKLNPTTMRMLFEVQDLAMASPATVSRCGMVYLSLEELGWRPAVKTWCDKGLPERLPMLTPEQREHIYGLFDAHVDPGLAWLAGHRTEHIPAVDNNRTTTLCCLMESLLQPERGFEYGHQDQEHVKQALNLIFTFAYVWALGGNLPHTIQDEFDDFVREELQSVMSIPGSGTVFDYWVDMKSKGFPGIMRQWWEIIPSFQYRKDVPYFQMLVPTMDTVRFSYLLEACLDVERSVLMTGVTGVGKSVITVAALNDLSERKGVVPYVMNFSAQTQAVDAQAVMEAKLEKKRKTRFGAPAGKRIVFFVDDVNMPAKEKYGAQPPIELLRQFQDARGFYDRSKLYWKEVENTTLCAACAPPGGGRQEMSPRFVRHFTLLNVPPPSERATKTILGSIFNGFLAEFPPAVSSLSKPIVDASVEAYTRISEELLPTPTKSHYTFNLRDLSKVFQGMLMVTPTTCNNSTTMQRLWVHEACRVFHDRLVNNEDKDYFKTMISSLMSKYGLNDAGTYEDLFVNRTIMFGDFLRMGLDPEERRYEEIEDMGKLLNVLQDYLDEYNTTSTNAMNLVFFMDAIEHITRIARILRQPRGNAMLVGVGGSGKASLTRFASFITGYKTFSIELARGYGEPEFREDLKKLYHTAGIEGKQVVFLFSDSQIVSESFLEDINNMLNSGEVPGMYSSEEKDKVCSDIRDWVMDRGGNPTKDNCYSSFIQRVRDNLHIVLTMSPVGDGFRVRCRQFPSLISCSTIDWFTQWPDEALLSVSRKFLAGTELGGDEIKEALANMCVVIHNSVSQASDKFYAELRRRYYTTPKSYLDLINLYLQLLGEKREENMVAKDRLVNGLNKLNETNALVDSMKDQLAKLAPVLESKSKSTSELLAKVAADQQEAEATKRTVAMEEREVKNMQREIQVVADGAKADLEEAMPALTAAIDSLDALNKNDITEIKSFPKPPSLVQMTMEAVCILKQEKPDWDTAKRMLSDSNFLRSLKDFDRDNIPDSVAKKLRKYVEDPQFNPENVAKQSKAAMSLCMWAHAMDVYNRVAKVVQPKRQRLAQAEAELAQANRKLSDKQSALRKVEANVDALKQQLQQAQQEQKELNEEADLTRKRLDRAGKLTNGLASEGVRWAETAESLQSQAYLLTGDVFLSAACIAYYGAFTRAYRRQLVADWIAEATARGIPVSQDCTLRGTLASPVEVREWNLKGLPTDDVSIDNGILVARGKRWPLMIDPQGQANNWLKNMEHGNGLRTVKLTDPNFLRTLENSIRVGTPVLLEDVGEVLDPALEPILQQAVFKVGGRNLIRLGDTDVDYDPNFKLYITTKMANPHYLPEVCIKVTIINFTVTMKGLEDQLLGDVVRKERPDLEEAKDRLVVSISNDKKQLQELEDKILRLLKESQGNILDDEQLINVLNHSKLTSSVITNRVLEAEETETFINAAREQYRPAATRGSILYFVIADLATINAMYQFSLAFFARMFSYCIDNSEKADNMERRLELLSSYVTQFTFNNVSRGLFEEHKLLFAFLVATSLLRHPSSGKITEPEWSFFVWGAISLDPPSEDAPSAPITSFITASQWATLVSAEQSIESLKGLAQSMRSQLQEWEQWIGSPEPEEAPLPGDWESHISGTFGKLALLKIFREEKLIFGCARFVSLTLGHSYTEPPPWTLDEVFPDTNARTPIIFILSTGADPTTMLQRFAERKGWAPGERLHMISLGQGQGPIAEMLMHQAAKAGDWVCLQNCHLASSWMLRLEERVEELGKQDNEAVHPDFRLWLTSMPSPVFPVMVLQNGIKLTNEPPKGVRANMARNYNAMDQSVMDSCPSKPKEWRKLLFSLSFFHAVIQERRKFGSLGWNIKYEFNTSDLECSMMTLRMFLSEQEHVPWPALEYVIGQINYGGRVMDDLDRRCLMSILRQYIAPHVLDDSHKITPQSGRYVIPPDGPLESYQAYLASLPPNEDPEVFGMHPNANISFQLNETRRLVEAIATMQPRMSGGSTSHGSTDDMVAGLAASMQANLPPLLDRADAAPGVFDRTPEGQLNSLSVVLGQEMDRFNRLTNVLGSTLAELQKAIKGLVVMSAELESMYHSMTLNQVPALWSRVAYPSLKPLASWMKDYHERVAFMRRWLQEGVPKSFWLPGFFFPQGFMTGVLQMHARKYSIPIDTLGFGFKVMEARNASEVGKPPEEGVYIDGLWLDGAQWRPPIAPWRARPDSSDGKLLSGYLDESPPGVMHSPLPVVHFNPHQGVGVHPAGHYSCPLYKTGERAGALSTTGQSTNYVLSVALPMRPGTTEDQWILQGVALLCMLND